MNASETEISSILELAWQSAARLNPMVLTKLRPDFEFESLRNMIRDCLEKGLNAKETCDRAIKELLRSASTNAQPSESCDDDAIREEQSAV